jgi:hypothetical protein
VECLKDGSKCLSTNLRNTLLNSKKWYKVRARLPLAGEKTTYHRPADASF